MWASRYVQESVSALCPRSFPYQLLYNLRPIVEFVTRTIVLHSLRWETHQQAIKHLEKHQGNRRRPRLRIERAQLRGISARTFEGWVIFTAWGKSGENLGDFTSKLQMVFECLTRSVLTAETSDCITFYGMAASLKSRIRIRVANLWSTRKRLQTVRGFGWIYF
jgi:hypothetical protein